MNNKKTFKNNKMKIFLFDFVLNKKNKEKTNNFYFYFYSDLKCGSALSGF